MTLLPPPTDYALEQAQSIPPAAGVSDTLAGYAVAEHAAEVASLRPEPDEDAPETVRV